MRAGPPSRPSRRLWEQLNAIKEALPYIEDIWLNDSTGNLRLTSAAFPTPSSNVADRDAFREQAISDKGLFVGEPIIGRVTKPADLHGEPETAISERFFPRHCLGHGGAVVSRQLLGQAAVAQAKPDHADAWAPTERSSRNIRHRWMGSRSSATTRAAFQNAIAASRAGGPISLQHRWRAARRRLPQGRRFAALHRHQHSRQRLFYRPGLPRRVSTASSRSSPFWRSWR